MDLKTLREELKREPTCNFVTNGALCGRPAKARFGGPVPISLCDEHEEERAESNRPVRAIDPDCSRCGSNANVRKRASSPPNDWYCYTCADWFDPKRNFADCPDCTGASRIVIDCKTCGGLGVVGLDGSLLRVS